MNARVLVNGVAAEQIQAMDRGLAYGDGLFETIRAVEGRAPLWLRHMARLQDGCKRLDLPVPDPDRLAVEFAQVVAGMPAAVGKIIVTRGVGTRGYAPPAVLAATRIVAGFALPELPPAWYREGIRVRCCRLRLARQPRLAGIKHLNRLEQVLARAEWSDPDVIEGLLFDQADHLVCATAANVFVGMGGCLWTPPVDACGVAGVLRGALLDALPEANVGRVNRADLAHVEELFVVSSVRGVLPVRRVDDRELRVGSGARAAQAYWRTLGFSGGDA